jgi:transcriptional regulator GlxA family with amidase domain
VEPKWAEETAGELGASGIPHWRVPQISRPGLVGPWEAVRCAIESGRDSSEVDTRVREAFMSTLRAAAEAPPPAPAQPPLAVRRMRQLMRKHLRDAVPLGELAVRVGLEPWQLTRRFNEACGMTPHRYWTHLRLNEACRQLRCGLRPSEVDAGFSDQSHLGRTFRKMLGLTPAEYADTPEAFAPHSRSDEAR